jgi:hypothetical protein
MPELNVLEALLTVARERIRQARDQTRQNGPDDAGGIISEYAVVLTIAVAAIAIIAGLIVVIRSRFAAFTGQ